MANAGQPTISQGATGDAVRWLQRALRRTPDLGLAIDGIFGPLTDQAVRQFQQASGLAVDGVVGPLTWAALPNGAPMPVLQLGSSGPVVANLQTVLANGSSQGWPSPGATDADFGPLTQASVEGFQSWAGIASDGVVGDQTWSVSLHAMSATLESAVGLQYVTG